MTGDGNATMHLTLTRCELVKGGYAIMWREHHCGRSGEWLRMWRLIHSLPGDMWRYSGADEYFVVTPTALLLIGYHFWNLTCWLHDIKEQLRALIALKEGKS